MTVFKTDPAGLRPERLGREDVGKQTLGQLSPREAEDLRHETVRLEGALRTL